MAQIYKKVGRRYVEIAHDDWDGFPMDGIWMVKFKSGRESSATCIARLDDLPEPYPFYSMILDRDKFATFLVHEFDKPIALQQVADHLIDYLSQLNKDKKLNRIDKPHKPTFRLPKATERYNGNFKLLMIKRIMKRTNYTVIEFEHYEKKLYVSELTAFVDNKNRGRTLDQLKSGDVIWIDVYAYNMDKSLK